MGRESSHEDFHVQALARVQHKAAMGTEANVGWDAILPSLPVPVWPPEASLSLRNVEAAPSALGSGRVGPSPM